MNEQPILIVADELIEKAEKIKDLGSLELHEKFKAEVEEIYWGTVSLAERVFQKDSPTLQKFFRDGENVRREYVGSKEELLVMLCFAYLTNMKTLITNGLIKEA